MRRGSNAQVTDDNWPALPDTLITGESASHYMALRTSKLGYIHITASRYSDDRDPREQTSLFFVWQGREYWRKFDKFYGLRWATRLAEAFAREVVGRYGK